MVITEMRMYKVDDDGDDEVLQCACFLGGRGVEGLVRGIVCFFSVDHGKLTRELAYLNFLRCLASFFTIWIRGRRVCSILVKEI
jgi:hypothetical protein